MRFRSLHKSELEEEREMTDPIDERERERAALLAELDALEDLQAEVRRRKQRIAMTGEPTGLSPLALPPRRSIATARRPLGGAADVR
jgi:hypothetical protein